jgi:hypothetical protein
MCQPIHKAVKDNNLPEVRQLLKNDPDLVLTKADVNAKDNSGTLEALPCIKRQQLKGSIVTSWKCC